MASVLSVERKLRISESNEVYFSCRTKAISTKLFLHSKKANFVISESRSQIYLGYAEYKQNLDKNRIIKEEKYLRNLCYLWEINNNFPCHPCFPCAIKLYQTHVKI